MDNNRNVVSTPSAIFFRLGLDFRIALKIELRNKSVRCNVWSIALCGSEAWTLTKLERKYLESFEVWCWRRMEKIKCSEKVANEVLERIGENRTLLNNILC